MQVLLIKKIVKHMFFKVLVTDKPTIILPNIV